MGMLRTEKSQSAAKQKNARAWHENWRVFMRELNKLNRKYSYDTLKILHVAAVEMEATLFVLQYFLKDRHSLRNRIVQNVGLHFFFHTISNIIEGRKNALARYFCGIIQLIQGCHFLYYISWIESRFLSSQFGELSGICRQSGVKMHPFLSFETQLFLHHKMILL